MSLTDGLNEAAQTLRRFADLLESVSVQTIRISIEAVTSADDKAEADAIKRGQRPQQVDALKQALGR